MTILILWLLLVIVFIGSALMVAGREEDQSLEIQKKLLELQKTDGLGHF